MGKQGRNGGEKEKGEITRLVEGGMKRAKPREKAKEEEHTLRSVPTAVPQIMSLANALNPRFPQTRGHALSVAGLVIKVSNVETKERAKAVAEREKEPTLWRMNQRLRKQMRCV